MAVSTTRLRMPALPRCRGCASGILAHRRLRKVVGGRSRRKDFAFFEETIELSRRFRALKLWLSLRYHGLEKFREAIEEVI